MNQSSGNRKQNQYDDAHRSQHPATNVLAHGLPVGVVFHHDAHGQKQIDHHVDQQPHHNNLDNHQSILFRKPGWLPRCLAGLLVVLAIGTMVSLGLWQLDRMEQKQQRLASIAQKSAAAPVSLAALPANTDVRDFPVQFSGSRQDTSLFLIDNQIEQGQVGYAVVATYITAAGPVLVNFGWVAAPPFRHQLPAVTLPQTLESATGVIAVPGHNPVVSETTTGLTPPATVLQQLDIDAVATLSDTQLQPYVVQLTDPSAQFVRNWQPVVMSPEKHLGYAIQWFGLALAATFIALFIYVYRR